ESTWNPLNNLANTQESVQLYLEKKNQKEGLSGEEGDDVRIVNSFSLETRTQGWNLNPDPKSLQAAGPMDQGATFLHFLEAKPLQADAKNVVPNGEVSQTKGISAPNGGVIKFPNGGNKISTISFMSLKSTLVANQEPSTEGGTGLQIGPMTTTIEQDNQVANSRSLINEKTPGLGVILPHLNQNPHALFF
ncbi:hypothetical protein DSO57_1029047, partial [Entomophthora muscae]